MDEFLTFWKIFFRDFVVPGINFLVMDVILPNRVIGLITILLSGVLAYGLYYVHKKRKEEALMYKEEKKNWSDAVIGLHEERDKQTDFYKGIIRKFIDELSKHFQPDKFPDDIQDVLKTISIEIVLPKTANDYYLKGYSCLMDEKYETAIDHFDGAIRRAAAHHGLRFTDNKIEVYKDSQITPETAGAYYGIGFANQKMNAYKSAITYYGEATKCKPDYKTAYLNMGYSLRELDERSEAREAFHNGIETINVEEAAEVHNNIGLLHAEEKENIEKFKAIESYCKAVKINPKYAKAYINMGDMYVDLGFFDLAEHNYNKAIKCNK